MSNLGNINKVQIEVCRHFRMKLSDLLGRRRTPTRVMARHLAMHICREMGMSSTEIGEGFMRDHSTVLHACMSAREKIRDPARQWGDEHRRIIGILWDSGKL